MPTLLRDLKAKWTDPRQVYPSLPHRLSEQSRYHIRTIAKNVLARLIPDLPRLASLLRLAKLRGWQKTFGSRRKFPSRFDLYDFINEEILKGQPVTYLEFGVFRGETIHYWSVLNDNGASRFYGFDTFGGLPENWVTIGKEIPKGHFDVEGRLPDIQDKRVSFVAGLFQETLRDFLSRTDLSNRKVIHIDSDLYSSALFVLTACDSILDPGTIIVFDEFSSIENEFRALQDYCAAYRREYRAIGSAGRNCDQVGIEIIK